MDLPGLVAHLIFEHAGERRDDSVRLFQTLPQSIDIAVLPALGIVADSMQDTDFFGKVEQLDQSKVVS